MSEPFAPPGVEHNGQKRWTDFFKKLVDDLEIVSYGARPENAANAANADGKHHSTNDVSRNRQQHATEGVKSIHGNALSRPAT